ncbi:hypothetical protein RHCRD62_10849 [Rhodococcus sp. RD6.2]|nr:hypothetical protein RHCRD62_10849 [Rhodococcus sp. RD6.2]
MDARRGTRVVRPAGMERRLDQDARRDAQHLPAHALCREPAGAWRVRRCRTSDLAVEGRQRRVPGRRDRRPHRALGVVVRGRPTVRWTGALRARERRAHCRHRQPTGQEELDRGAGRARRVDAGTAVGPGAVAIVGSTPVGLLVGGLGAVVAAASGRPTGTADHGERAEPGDRNRPRHLRVQLRTRLHLAR